MKVVILAGGLGTRFSEETIVRPKPLIKIGGMPILWHIMKIYSAYGFKDFIVCAGYKHEEIKNFFLKYFFFKSDIEFSIKKNKFKILNNKLEDWNVRVINTGYDSNTGGRLLKIKKYFKHNEAFLLTYGDGLSNLNINKLIKSHQKSKKLVTLTGVQPEGRYGIISLSKSSLVNKFIEKPVGDKNWVNGGFFVVNSNVLKYLKSNKDVWEKNILEKLCKNKQLNCYKHHGFWKCMDTRNDKEFLEKEWKTKRPKWKNWKI